MFCAVHSTWLGIWEEGRGVRGHRCDPWACHWPAVQPEASLRLSEPRFPHLYDGGWQPCPTCHLPTAGWGVRLMSLWFSVIFTAPLPWRSFPIKRAHLGISLVVQWLRLFAPNAGGLGLIPSQGTRSYMPQLRVCMPQQRSNIPNATTKIRHRQKKKKSPPRNLIPRLLCSLGCWESPQDWTEGPPGSSNPSSVRWAQGLCLPHCSVGRTTWVDACKLPRGSSLMEGNKQGGSRQQDLGWREGQISTIRLPCSPRVPGSLGFLLGKPLPHVREMLCVTVTEWPHLQYDTTSLFFLSFFVCVCVPL